LIVKTGQLISLEGIEGAGKSTAQQFVVDYLKTKDITAIATREPGGTAMAETIREVLLHPKPYEPIEPQTELLLMFASRAQHIAHCIRPALQAGQWVVSDRYVDASYAYQGGGRGLSLDLIRVLDQHVVGHYYPALTLLLDLPPELGITRTEKRGTPKDRIESEKIYFFERVRELYRERASADPKRIVIIDASAAEDQVQWQIQKTLDAFLI
jgi:dTMP kinase